MTASVKQSRTSPPRTAARSGPRRDGLARRQAILVAALRLFREKGFHGTSINEIGASAGVSGPALYRHFGSKGDILAEAIRDGARQIAEATREALAREGQAPEEAVEALVRSYVAVALENADIHAAYVLEARHLPDASRRPFHKSERQHRDRWTEVLRAARPEMEIDTARTLVRMAIYCVTSLCLQENALERKRLVELTTQRLMALLLTPAT